MFAVWSILICKRAYDILTKWNHLESSHLQKSKKHSNGLTTIPSRLEIKGLFIYDVKQLGVPLCDEGGWCLKKCDVTK